MNDFEAKYNEDGSVKYTWKKVMEIADHFQCSTQDAEYFLDLRSEGYSTYQAAVMSGIADPDY